MTTIRDQDLDTQGADDWYALDQEAWQLIEEPNNPQRPQTIPKDAKSISLRSTRP